MAPQINVGTLLYDYQAIDAVGPLDVLSSGSQLIAKALQQYGPVDEIAIARAPEFKFHHIGVNIEPVKLLTIGLSILPTCTVDDAPDLDILLLPGPDPAGFKLDPRFAEFIRQHVNSGRLLFTNCTGASVAAAAGVLDGKRATVNNVEFNFVKKQYPKVKWTTEKKWVVDGNIWTAGGAVTGMDMTAHWLKENFGTEVLLLSTKGLDYEPRDVQGVQNVLPKRYDSAGNQLSTHIFNTQDTR